METVLRRQKADSVVSTKQCMFMLCHGPSNGRSHYNGSKGGSQVVTEQQSSSWEEVQMDGCVNTTADFYTKTKAFCILFLNDSQNLVLLTMTTWLFL